MLKMYRRRIIRRLQRRLKDGTKWVTILSLVVLLRLNKNIEVAKNVKILHARLREFEVVDMTIIPNISYCLNLDKLCDY